MKHTLIFFALLFAVAVNPLGTQKTDARRTRHHKCANKRRIPGCAAQKNIKLCQILRTSNAYAKYCFR